MKDKIKHYLKEITIFIIIMSIFANVVSLYKSSDLNKKPLSIKNITLVDGTKYILPDTKPVLIHFWATWCPTCKIEASNIQTLSQSYNVLTVAVKSGTNEDIREWLKESNYNFNVINDNSGFLSYDFNIAAFPTTFIYDKNKELIFSEVGYTSTLGLWLRMWWAGL